MGFTTRYKTKFVSLVLIASILLPLLLGFDIPTTQAASGPGISNIQVQSPNVARHQKIEITFDVSTSASDPYFPYDTSPPAGVDPAIGVTVDALFSPDRWVTTYRQPAFYYQDFDYQVKNGQDWLYPMDDFHWVVRFSPHLEGTWEFRLVAEDASGITETSPQSFTVVASDSKGFVRVSSQDPRYFEFEDETYFPGLGYNMNYRDIDWVNPVQSNQEHFQIMGQNGIQLIRMWLSQWSIFGTEWNPWRNFVGNGYLPSTGVSLDQVHPDSEVSLRITNDWNKCVVIGWEAPRVPLKRDTEYIIKLLYKTEGIAGPRVAGSPFGLVAKFGGWLWDEGDPLKRCDAPGTGSPITPYQSGNTSDWQILEGTFNSGGSDFSDLFYIALENVIGGVAFIDHVWIQEDLGDSEVGPNLLQKPDMDHHQYFDQRNAFAFDQVLELAEQNDIYLRPVILEKNDWIFNRIAFDGSFDIDNPSNNNFYGDWRNVTKIRWLHQAWWRYLQARWGYSPNIHSWELLNEGDPFNGLHYTLADEFAKYMHQFAPNDHLVSTSFWHSFPKDEFWANPNYSNVDFADYHRYIPESDSNFPDAALSTIWVSDLYGAKQSSGAGKPLIRGETGFVVSGSEPPSSRLDQDVNGVWLHNFIWAGINPGGLIESYWDEDTHIYAQNSDGSYRFDHRDIYRTYFNFIKDVPLANGFYQDAQASVSNASLRAWGQKDLVNGRAHLWIQHSDHTWKKVIDGVPIPEVSASVTLSGFQPSTSYALEWWDPYQVDENQQILTTENITSGSGGSITIQVVNFSTDIALKLRPANPGSVPTFTDVPFSYWAHDEIEALYQVGYVMGCSESPRLYCPDKILDRAESSVFVLRGEHGAIPDPPYAEPPTPTFADVVPSFWGYGWIESLWHDGYTSGCGVDPLVYCPDQQHTRAEGSVFFLRIANGVTYQPPNPVGIFSDVDIDAWYAGWVEEAYNEGILPACGADPLQFCPDQPLDRAWAAFMMVQAKGGLSAISP